MAFLKAAMGLDLRASSAWNCPRSNNSGSTWGMAAFLLAIKEEGRGKLHSRSGPGAAPGWAFYVLPSHRRDCKRAMRCPGQAGVRGKLSSLRRVRIS
ncbi:hypothetical protein D9M73_297510 [compost metagenome]